MDRIVRLLVVQSKLTRILRNFSSGNPNQQRLAVKIKQRSPCRALRSSPTLCSISKPLLLPRRGLMLTTILWCVTIGKLYWTMIPPWWTTSDAEKEVSPTSRALYGGTACSCWVELVKCCTSSSIVRVWFRSTCCPSNQFKHLFLLPILQCYSSLAFNDCRLLHHVHWYLLCQNL